MMRVCFATTLLLSAMAQDVPDTGHCTSDHCCTEIVKGMCKGNTHTSADPPVILTASDEVDCTGQKMDIADKEEKEGTDVATCCQDVPKCSTTTCPTGWTAKTSAADTLIAGETAAMDIDANYGATGADVATCCELIAILDSNAEITAANAVAATADTGLTLNAVGALTCADGYTGTVVPTVTADAVLALTGCEAITGYCTDNLHGDFECAAENFVLPALDYSCTVATGDGTCTRTDFVFPAIEILVAIEGDQIPATMPDDGTACTATAGTTCTVEIKPKTCPAPQTEDKTSGAQVVAPFGIALAAAIVLQ